MQMHLTHCFASVSRHHYVLDYTTHIYILRNSHDSCSRQILSDVCPRFPTFRFF